MDEARSVPSLAEGDRLEVYWTVTYNEGTDGEETHSLWWPGCVKAVLQAAASEADATVQLAYEELDDFEAEETTVTILDLLHDQGSGELMAWRLVGDEWDDAAAVLGGGGGASDADATVTAGEVADEQMREIQEATGVATEAEAVSQLQSSLPRGAVIDGVHKLSEFIDRFKQHMQREMSSAELPAGEFVVTKDMVDGFVSELRASGARRE